MQADRLVFARRWLAVLTRRAWSVVVRNEILEEDMLPDILRNSRDQNLEKEEILERQCAVEGRG